MPVVLRIGGFKFSFYAGDHDPPHVHATYGGEVAIIEIASGAIRWISAGMRAPDVRQAAALVRAHGEDLMAAWIDWQAERRT
jgi:hypothetical protein